MAGGRARISRAAAAHRRAAAIADAAAASLDAQVPAPRSATEEREVRDLARRLRVTGGRLAPGWLGTPLDAVPHDAPLGGTEGVAEMVRVGVAGAAVGPGEPDPGRPPAQGATSFPVVVPLGHLGFDADARDPRVAGVLEAVLLRLLAAAEAGSLLARVVDPGGVVSGSFAPLHDAGIMPPPVTDRAGLLAVLCEAEQWLRGGGGRTRSLLLAVASWPPAVEPGDLARLSALARRGPAVGLHLLVAGLPPLDRCPGPLPLTTQVTLRQPYALVGHPPDGSFAAPPPPGGAPTGGLNAQVRLDPSPPPELAARVCAELAGRAVDHARVSLGELLPDGPLWSHDAAGGLDVVVGRAGDTPVTLRLSEPASHWLVGGRSGSGKSTLLLDTVYGLCSRYRPDQLTGFLLDFTGRATFADFVPSAHDPSYLPHARAVGVSPDLEAGLAILRRVASQMSRRAAAAPAGSPAPLPRVVCVIDGVDALLAGAGPLAREAAGLLAALARQGGRLGIHLILAGRDPPPAPVSTPCRVRIALPGGSGVLDPANAAAAGLALGTAVVNTASGLGGPRGATRAHEQVVRFPDPGAEPSALAGLRHRLWRMGAVPAAGGPAGDDGPDDGPGEP
jgi:hypothetical protein